MLKYSQLYNNPGLFKKSLIKPKYIFNKNISHKGFFLFFLLSFPIHKSKRLKLIQMRLPLYLKFKYNSSLATNRRLIRKFNRKKKVKRLSLKALRTIRFKESRYRWLIRKRHFNFLRSKVKRRAKITKIRSFKFQIYKKQYFKTGFFFQNFRRRLLRNSLDLKFAFNYYTGFNRNKRAYNFCLKLKKKTKNFGVIPKLIYNIRYQFFFIVFFMNFLSKFSRKFVQKFRVFSILRYTYPKLFRFFAFYAYVFMFVRNRRVITKAKTALCKAFLFRLEHRMGRMFSKILYLYRGFLRKYSIIRKYNLNSSLHHLRSAKTLISSGYFFINGSKQVYPRKTLQYGDAIYTMPRWYMYYKEIYMYTWWLKTHFKYNRSLKKSINVPWCSFVLMDANSRHQNKKLTMFKKFPKKLFEIYFVLYR